MRRRHYARVLADQEKLLACHRTRDEALSVLLQEGMRGLGSGLAAGQLRRRSLSGRARGPALQRVQTRLVLLVHEPAVRKMWGRVAGGFRDCRGRRGPAARRGGAHDLLSGHLALVLIWHRGGGGPSARARGQVRRSHRGGGRARGGRGKRRSRRGGVATRRGRWGGIGDGRRGERLNSEVPPHQAQNRDLVLPNRRRHDTTLPDDQLAVSVREGGAGLRLRVAEPVERHAVRVSSPVARLYRSTDILDVLADRGLGAHARRVQRRLADSPQLGVRGLEQVDLLRVVAFFSRVCGE
mmetsp:Transcript_25526/g.76629  ORF Transcript_25526/g.76629 Transcript_25526/m.76629 type:complete len:296 (-) Transcript_25526:881-1768(-)